MDGDLAPRTAIRLASWIEDAIDDWRLSSSQRLKDRHSLRGITVPRADTRSRRFNGLSISGSGSGCNDATGRFVDSGNQRSRPDGTVQRFAADFEHHCEDLIPALSSGPSATTRRSSDDRSVWRRVPVISGCRDAAGSRPHHWHRHRLRRRRLAVSADANGNHAVVTLTATPDFGYTFMGWTEDCSGGLDDDA